MKQFLAVLLALAATAGCQSKATNNILRDPQAVNGGGFPITKTVNVPQEKLVPRPIEGPMEVSLEIPVEQVEVTIYCINPCPPCVAKKKQWGAGDKRIKINWTYSPLPNDGTPQAFPAIRWKSKTGRTLYPTKIINGEHHYYIPNTLDELWDIIQRNRLADAGPVSGRKMAGTIHGRDTIVAMQTWIRERVGENVLMEFRWDRTGSQNFPLLKGGDWSAVAIYGRSGRFSLAAKEAVNLPVKSGGFTYIVDGSDVVIHLDEVRLAGLADKIIPQNKQRVSAGDKVGFDPMTVMTVLSVARTVWSLLHPQADMDLGGNVSATARLQGDLLSIDFQQGPKIALVLLFTFRLSVKRVEITPSMAKVLFDGNWLARKIMPEYAFAVAG